MKSMTAFARHEAQFDWGSLSWEIRSVNQRYLEPYFKLPELVKALEMPARDSVKRVLSRGKVELGLKLETAQNERFQVNQDRLQALSEAIQTVQMTLPEATHVNPLQLLEWPGMMQAAPIDGEQLEQDILQALDEALKKLNAARQREGDSLQNVLAEKCQAVRQLVAQVESKLPEIQQRLVDNLKQRIAEFTDQADEARFHQEIAFLMQKMDVMEEIDRLKTHLDEVERLIHTNDVVGRRLDFLMQELNREANTLGSKSIHSDTSQISVELKVLIEQMREQIQNIE